jgi:hypothetical protein
MASGIMETNALTRVSSTSVDFNGVAAATLFTVPVGYTFIPAFVVIRGLSATMNTVVFTLGISTAKTEFRTALTASGANGTTKALIVYPNYNATPAAGSGLITILVAGTLFQIDITTGSGGACTGTIDLFGFLY